MAIYGVGSNWGGKELKEVFFREDKFILGWNEETANDIYSFIGALKVGDILYIKANQPGSRTLRIKGIGIIKTNFIGCLNSGDYKDTKITDWEELFIKVYWIYKEVDQNDFVITIPENEGKLTSVRACTIFEEHLPFVQNLIIDKIINMCNN